MPYIECERCRFTSFSASYRFNVEHCAKCGATLPRRSSIIDPARQHPLLRRKSRDAYATPGPDGRS
jgi:hypothetical protein